MKRLYKVKVEDLENLIQHGSIQDISFEQKFL